ncbi:hypothetical protein ABTK06_19925, partial [Acinetobacter baumannii]
AAFQQHVGSAAGIVDGVDFDTGQQGRFMLIGGDEIAQALDLRREVQRRGRVEDGGGACRAGDLQAGERGLGRLFQLGDED